MNRNIILFLLLIILGAITWIVVRQNSGSTIAGELSDFAIDDTTAIDKIFLADKEGNAVTLTKLGNNTWVVNDKYRARHDAISTLLKTIKLVEVRSPVGKNAYTNVIKRIAAKGVKTEIYSKGKLLKTYYVGGPTQDQLGTYMYMENSSVPYATHIPGFNGYLSPRYFTKEIEWRDKYVFAYDVNGISQLTVEDKEHASTNFEIKKLGDKTYMVTDIPTNSTCQASIDRITQYFDMIAKVAMEGVITELPQQTIDSVLQAGWFRKIAVVTNEKSTVIAMYKMPFDERTKALLAEGEKVPPYDGDRFYARINNEPQLVLAQYLQFDKLFRKANEFCGTAP